MNNIKYKLGAGLIALATTGSAWADQLEDVRAAGKITCGVLSGFAPYGFENPETREPIGYEIDICKAFAEYLGVEAELKVVSTQGRIPELLQERIDTITGLISYTAARDEQVDYSGIYMRGTVRFMVNGDTDAAQSHDLSKGRIAVAKGSTLETFLLENYPDATIVGFDDQAAAYLALKVRRVDALLTQTETLSAMKNRDPDGAGLVILPEVIYATRFSLIFRPGETAIIDEATTFLKGAESDGTIQAIWDKWFGPDTEYKMERDFVAGDPAKI